ncbi:MAG: signal peptide peptidase SppA, partial [Muribaculaceae bacterium]|nr:signal peptide peptidase SppA [Muribaculaceae bacterium]
MLKKFFTVFLGSMAAIWLSVIFVFILIAVIIGSLAGGFLASTNSVITVQNKSVLVLDLKGTIEERETTGSLKDQIMDSERATGSLCEYIAAIDKAASDKRIEGMLIKCGGAYLGTASRQELIEAITRFRNKKFVISYSDYYSQGDYFVACAANEMYLNPVGAVDIHGIASTTTFFTGLLDKLGIKVQIVKVGRFKSAVEPFILKSASEASVTQTKTYIDGIWNEVSSYIASRRATSADSVTAWASGIATFQTPEQLIADSIVDRLAYEREIKDILKKRIGLKEKDKLNTISVNDYMSAVSITASDKRESRHIAVYYATGDIVDSGSGGIVSAVVAPDIIKLADDDNVAGLILRVNSGGGSAFASEQIWEAVEYFKSKDKPVYASMSDVAASGGYYISCGADRIFADPATLTGSIGIFGMIPCFEGLVTDKLGINFTTVESNPNADLLNICRPLPAAQLNAMQKMVENGYETFVSRVAAGRHISTDSVKAIGEGRVWYGRDALRIGLVDTLASLH